MTVATFYTISDAPFFPGTVALLNSLRLTGNDGKLVILDLGLTRSQRERLDPYAEVIQLERGLGRHAYTHKPFPYLVGAEGTTVIIDSDIIVTESLDQIVGSADRGKICLFRDGGDDWRRWFAEWQGLFELDRPPRRGQIYRNSGFIAFSVSHWPGLLERWWSACDRIPAHAIRSPQDNPLRDSDQDALNAILMSEIPSESLPELPDFGMAHPDQLRRVHVVNPATLECTLDGKPTTLLHHSLSPKVWRRGGWRRAFLDEAYVRLLPRALFGDDVPLRLGRADVPIWLAPGRRGRAALFGCTVCRRLRGYSLRAKRLLQSAGG